ncbi:MAG: RNA polymerase-binding protein DksA [Gammaproteobacteria bacterium]
MPTTKKSAQKKASAPKKKAAAKTKASTAKSTAKKAPAKRATEKAPAPKKAAPKKAAAKSKQPPKTSAQGAVYVGPNADIAPYELKAGEEYMNKDQVEHFRKILWAWKHDLMEEVDRTVHHMQDEAANFPDPNDRATQESEFSMELRTRDRERKLIKKIDEALDKLDHDEYGYCDSCGIEIGVRRLEARPTATLCIDCKTLDEIREKQMRG